MYVGLCAFLLSCRLETGPHNLQVDITLVRTFSFYLKTIYIGYYSLGKYL